METSIKKNILTGILSIGLLISLFFNYKWNKQIENLETETLNNGILIQTNKIELDTLRLKYPEIVKERDKFITLYNKNSEKQITTKYITIYENIENSNDSIQYSIFTSLINSSRKTEFKRN